MSAINSIVAKALILLDAMLEPFVTVSTAALPSNCGIYEISGGLTACGEDVLAYRVRAHGLQPVLDHVDDQVR